MPQHEKISVHAKRTYSFILSGVVEYVMDQCLLLGIRIHQGTVFTHNHVGECGIFYDLLERLEYIERHVAGNLMPIIQR
ncbi:hypothetical protein ABWA82_000570 [Yersinia enterocolitica]|nr:hypothetical protein [Yersinia enterocolitica]